MVKKIKFALLMKNGTKVRTLEELRNNFDLETCISYFIDGKLQKWLEDRYYDDEAQALQTLDVTQLDIPAFCRILGVSYQPDMAVDVQTICQKNEKLDALKQLTDDEGILSHADETAFSQDELEALLAEGTSTIYLCGKQFTVSLEWANRHYIGIIYTPDITIQADSPTDLTERHITFEDVKLPSQLLLRPVPEAHRYLQITDDCRLDKKVLADQALYPGDTWKDFLYILFQYKYEIPFSILEQLLPRKIPKTWNDFLVLDDISTAKVMTNEEKNPYQGKYITGYTWYDVTYEIMKYFMKKEPSTWKQRVTLKNYTEKWCNFNKKSANNLWSRLNIFIGDENQWQKTQEKEVQDVLNDIKKLLWAPYSFCETYSRLYHKPSWLDSTMTNDSIIILRGQCFLNAEEAEAEEFDDWDRKLIDYVATEVCKEVKKIKK